jgi:hypothetical protein
MRPVLDGELWVFCTFARDAPPDAALEPSVMVRELEGWTAVVPRHRAEAAALSFDGTFRRITLTVHSSLAAVGLLAAVAAALAEAGVACNAASGFYHDHLFVPADREDDAMRVLWQVATSGAAARG